MAAYEMRYACLNHLGYKLDLCNIGENSYDPNSFRVKTNFKDLKITRPSTDTDLSLIHNKGLVTVNGYVYPSQLDGNSLYVPDATVSMLSSRSNEVGTLVFKGLDQDLEKIPVTAGMISTEPEYTLYQKAMITTETELDKVILVYMGYMIFEDGVNLRRISNNTLVLDLSKLQYYEKLYELNRYRNIFDELGIPYSATNPFMIDADIARKDATIIRTLTHPNTFIVNIKVSTIEIEKQYVARSTVVGTFRSDAVPRYPLRVGYGKLSEYKVDKLGPEKYGVSSVDHQYSDHLFTRIDPRNQPVINDHRLPETQYKLTQAYFLKLSGQTY